MSTKVWKVSEYIIFLIIVISLLANMAGCSSGWITPNEINESYDFSKLDETVLAYYEAINNNDVDLFLYLLDLPASGFGRAAVSDHFNEYDPGKQKVLKYKIDKIDRDEGSATVYVSLRVKDYDRIFETGESLDLTKVNNEWKSKGFYGFPW